MTTTASTVDVQIVRWIDGHRIEHRHKRLSHGEALVLHVQEQCLPGRLVVFRQYPTPGPWETDPAAAEPAG